MHDNKEQMISSEEKVVQASAEVSERQRLPCRGCTRSCTDYGRCDGKPWRLIE